MRFSLRNLFIGLLALFVIMGSVFVYVAVQVFQHSLLGVASEEVAEELIREATISVALQQGFIILVMLILVGGGFFFLMHVFVIAPLSNLHASIQKVGKQKFEINLPKGPDNEIGDLFEAFNEMTTRLQEAREREENIARMKSEFLSITAHQLRTPLSALKWALHMTLEGDTGKLNKGQKEILHKGYVSNERMITLVNDLLDVVRIEEGKFDYKFEKLNLKKLIREIVNDMKILAQQKKLKLELHEPTNVFPEIAVDSEKLRLAIMNVLDNAIQYTRAGGQIDVELTYQNDVLIIVRDTGVGIPEYQLSRLFTKFFRADNAVRMQTTGSGLGLFIAKNIIEKHGGKIRIESQEGKGTTVYLTISQTRLKRGSDINTVIQ
jgi:signal transduction histidine kinase